ncbi:MAG TPA: chemotaxis protein CheB [Burkholderiaceae bacterium]
MRKRPASKPVSPKPEDAAAPPLDTPAAPATPFPVIGIGASAGGLEALEEFFKGIPPGLGAAIIVVQHLSSSQPSRLPELLQRVSALPVVEAADELPLAPDMVFVLPPGFDLGIRGQELRLTPAPEGHGLRQPIDAFLSSLAERGRPNSIGVLLSGMGSDGTGGLRVLKQHGGATFVQEPATAKYDSMPRSAIQAGVVDVVAAPGDLPAHIASYLQHALGSEPDAENLVVALESGAIEQVLAVLKRHTGQDFSQYKRSTVQRRIERRMAMHRLASVQDYELLLRDSKAEIELLFRELLIGVTSFFRDPEVWAQLREKTLPALLARRPDGATLRLWVAGCSTGEEAYSLAMVLAEAIHDASPRRDLPFKIFATDIDSDAIDKARAGHYPKRIEEHVSEARLQRFFVRDEFGYQVKGPLRETLVFAPQNVAMDPPFTKLDLLSCRNLLIYFDTELQRKLIPLFHYSLREGGVLMLGNAETTGDSRDLFLPLPGRSRLYQRLESFRRAGFVEFPFAFERHGRGVAVEREPFAAKRETPEPNLQALADAVLLQRYAPAAVLVTNDGDVLYISGKTGKYLEPAAGKANWNIFAMARDGLAATLNNAFLQAVEKQRLVVVRNVVIDSENGPLATDVSIDPLKSPQALVGMVMVVFSDRLAEAPNPAQPALRAPAGRNDSLEAQLSQSQDALRAARHHARASEDQLRTTNQALQSLNEELQSTNEELTTSKEEMQSMNEELQTVNQELQAKVTDLSRASDDMRNLLNSTDIATLFLDDFLNVRRFTTQTASIIKLISSDVGRPITDIVTELLDPMIADDAREVLGSLAFKEREVPALSDRWFNVRTMPYRTHENRIDGVVITFSDITRSKKLEVDLTHARQMLEAALSQRTIQLGKANQKLKAAKAAKAPKAVKPPVRKPPAKR